MPIKRKNSYTYLDLLKLENSGVLYEHHESTCRCYISRKLAPDELPVYPYTGKFGRGFKVLLPNWESTNYSRVKYFIYKEEKGTMKQEDLIDTANMLGLEIEVVENGIAVDNVLVKLNGRTVELFNNVTGEFLEGLICDDSMVVCGFVFYMICKYSSEINI